MEKKKMSLLKKIMIGIAIILLIIVILTARKFIILKSIQNKNIEYEKLDNIYTKSTYGYEKTTCERYIKGNIDKLVFKKEGTCMTQIMDVEEERNYFDYGDIKQLQISKIDRNSFWMSKMPVVVDTLSTSFEILYNSVVSRIHTEKIGGEEFYVIEGKLFTGFAYLQDTKSVKAYINKETGILAKRVETLKDGTERVTEFECSFGTVTDEDIKDPDRTEYTIVNY